jgi:release factor glutamine methyltransferase
MKQNSKQLTVLEAVQLSTGYLEEKGIESPRLNAELLLAGILNCKRLDLYLMFERPLNDEEVQSYREYIARRGKFEPLQYILGEVEFYGLKLKVSKDVLVPRPETELLVEEAIKLSSEVNVKTIIDIGSGSGNIAISLAKNLNGVKVTSIDLSSSAIKVAEANAGFNGVNDKIDFINSGIEEYQTNQQFDLIVSNPPYVSEQDYSSLQKEILEYEPIESVTDKSDGYKFYRLISERSNDFLKNGGYLLFEMASGQSEKIKSILEQNNFSDIKIVKDYQNIDRVIIGKKI